MSMPHRFLLTAAIAALALTAGCDKTPATPKTPAASPATATADDLADASAILKGETAPASGELPAGHPPINGAAAPPAQPALPPGHPPMGDASSQPPMPQIKTGVAPSGKELTYDVPESWKSQPPASSMRKAQFVLPSSAEGVEDGELVVFYFGPMEGGPVRQNLDRWRAMFVDEEGKPVSDEVAKEESIEVNGLKVTLLDVAGNYAASMMPGAAPAAPAKTNQRLLAAIVDTGEGPWFFKAVGPAETMQANKDSFDAFVRSVKY